MRYDSISPTWQEYKIVMIKNSLSFFFLCNDFYFVVSYEVDVSLAGKADDWHQFGIMFALLFLKNLMGMTFMEN